MKLGIDMLLETTPTLRFYNFQPPITVTWRQRELQDDSVKGLSRVERRRFDSLQEAGIVIIATV
jgi:hypothetical protein